MDSVTRDGTIYIIAADPAERLFGVSKGKVVSSPAVPELSFCTTGGSVE